MVKNLPAMQGMWVRSLGWEEPLEEGMATHSSILAWRIPWTEEPGGLQSIGLQTVGHDLGDLAHTAHNEKTLEGFKQGMICSSLFKKHHSGWRVEKQ